MTFAGTEFTTSGLLNSDTVGGATLSSSGASASASVAGSPYTIVPSKAAADGIEQLSISYGNGTLTVNPAVLTVTAKQPQQELRQAVTFGRELNLQPADRFVAIQ